MSDSVEVDRSAQQQRATVITNVVLCSVSILATASVLVLYFVVLRRRGSHIDNRISLRLAITVCAVDLLYSAAQILSNLLTSSGFWCDFSVFAYIAFTLLYLFATVAIAANLFVFFASAGAAKAHALATAANADAVIDAPKKRRLSLDTFFARPVLVYASAAIFMSLALALPGWFAGEYGMDPVEGTCWFKDGITTKTVVWQWLVLFAWVCLSIVFCLTVAIMVWLKLRREAKMVRLTRPLGPPRNATEQAQLERFQLRMQRLSEVRGVLLRVVIYILIPVFTQGWNIVINIATFVSDVSPFWLFILSYIATGIQGTLNAIAVVCLDPAVRSVFKAMRGGDMETSSDDTKVEPEHLRSSDDTRLAREGSRDDMMSPATLETTSDVGVAQFRAALYPDRETVLSGRMRSASSPNNDVSMATTPSSLSPEELERLETWRWVRDNLRSGNIPRTSVREGSSPNEAPISPLGTRFNEADSVRSSVLAEERAEDIERFWESQQAARYF